MNIIFNMKPSYLAVAGLALFRTAFRMPYFVDPIRQPVETMEIDTFRSAKPDDAEAIARLVNHAFRPRTGIAGWTHEAHLVAGDRIDPVQVRQILATKDGVLLLGMAGAENVACVQLERAGTRDRIGMLAVATGRQGGGLGKAMLAHA
jgi:ribosomal protein S18 acetylase RimI-like enzyme